jgi:hypothetical protein
MDWTSAFTFCNIFDMNLVTLETKEEHDDFLKMMDKGAIPDIQVYPYQQVLIGATDIGTESDFYWAATGKPLNYPIKWIDGEPNNLGNNEHCVGLWRAKANYEFNDIPCSGYQTPFICELVESEDDNKV